jgi:hypothetical protein
MKEMCPIYDACVYGPGDASFVLFFKAFPPAEELE